MKALITGITGQDGSYLAELLLEKGYEVHGILRRSSSFNTGRINHIFDRLHLHYGDLTDPMALVKILADVHPDEVYNLGAQSHVQVSFEIPLYTFEVDAKGTLVMLEAIRKLDPTIKFYQASTSELYGKVQETPQTETTPFYPRSPYGVAKIAGFWAVKNAREAYGLFACNGILFNHESPRRGGTFVTKKVTDAVQRISTGEQEYVTLGNLDSQRDWGHARDYVEAMWMMLQQDTPEDFVIATGQTQSVRKMVELAFSLKGMQISWEGTGVDEVGKDQHGDIRVQISEKYFRPTEVDLLLGDASKAEKVLGWKPKTTFEQLIQEMVC